MKGQFEIFKKLCMIKNNHLAISACTFLITFPYVAGNFQTDQITSGLFFEVSVGAHLFICKSIFIHMKMSLICVNEN